MPFPPHLPLFVALQCCILVRRFVDGCIGLLQHESIDVQEIQHPDFITCDDLVLPSGTPKARVGVLELAVGLYHAARCSCPGDEVDLRELRVAAAGGGGAGLLAKGNLAVYACRGAG